MTRADELYEQYKSQKEGKSQRYYKTRADELYDKFSTSKTFKNRIEYVDSKEKQGVRVYDIATSSYKIERPVDEDYIKNYINDFNDYAESSQNDYGNVTYNNANSYNAQYSQTSNELKGRAEKIARYLKANRKQIDPKSYSELLPYIEQSVDVLDTTSKAFGDANKFYSQFKNADEYNRYIAEQKYSTLDEDTFNLVKVVATGQNARSTTEGLTGFFSYWGDLLDGNPSTYNAQKNQVAQGNAAREQLKKMGYSDTDINTWVSMNIDGRVQESQKSTKQFAEEHPVLSSAISVPYKAITAPVEAALAIDNVVRGDTDVAKSANDVLAMDDYTRKVISDKIADDSKVGAWFYDVGMSTADSTFAALMPGGTGAALLGVDVASHTTNDLLERGADPTKALFGGIAAGAFETIFERLSIGNFKALQAVEPKTIKQVVGNLAKSMGVNASEETLTETANIVYDTLVNGSISNYQLAIDKYMADGMSPGEAKKQAIKDLAWQVGEATLSGAVQGGGMGVTGTATAYVKHKASQFITGSHIKAGNSMEAVIAAAKTLPTDSKVYKEAVKIEGKVANGEKVSSHEIGRLFSNTQDYIADNSAVTEGTFRGVNSLEELDRAYEQMKYDESKKVGRTNRETRKALESLAKEYEAAKTKLQKIEESNSTDIAQAASDAFTQAQMRVMSGESTESNSDVDTDNAETSSVDSQVMALAQQTASAEAGVAPTEFNTNPAPAEFNEDNLEEYKNSATLDIPVSQEHQLSDIEGKTILKNTNEAVNIKKITSIDKNSITLELDDGREVSSRDISYASEGEALVYETVADITNSAESANAIINAFDVAKPKDAYAWAAGARMVYTDGKNSIPFSEIAKQDFTSYLSNEAKKLIYNLGQQDAITETAKAEKAKKATNKKAKGKGRVTFEGKENFSTDRFTDVQRASVAYANVISKITGVEIRLFRSEKVNGRFVYTDENGEVKVAPNGKYIPGSNIIMLDINAGENGEGTMLYTLAHELTHYIKEWSPAKFKSLANFLMEQYGKQGRSVDELVQAQIRKAKSNRRTIDYDTAYEEVIADSMEAMLADGKVIEKLQQLYKQDKSLYRKIVDFVNKWVDKVKQVYTEYSPNSKEGKLVLKMKDSLEELQSKFAEAIMDASVNYKSAGMQKLNEVTETKNTAEAVKYSLKESDVKAAQAIGRKSINDLSSSELNSIKQFAEKYWKRLGAKSPFFRAWFGDWRVNDSTPIVVANRQGDGRGLVKNNDTDWEINISRKVFTETESHTSPKNNVGKTYLPYIRDIIRNAVLLDSYGINPTKSENSVLMHSFYAVADIGNGSEVLKLYVEEMYNPTAKDTSHRAYQLQGIEKQQFAVTGSGKTLAVSKQTVAIKTVSDLFGFVKQYDPNFSPKPTSKVVNADGTPKVMYHGTQNNFFVFDSNKIGQGATLFASQGYGFYFTENKQSATGYAKGGKIIEVYLNVKKPFTFVGKNNVKSNKVLSEFADKMGISFNIKEYEGFLDFEKRTGSVLSRIVKDKGKEFTAFLKEKGYDGIEYTSYNYENNTSDKCWVVFEPTQIKSATGNIGTFDGSNPDIRYSDRYSDIDLNETALSYFGKTYSWKETGYLLTNGSKLDFSGKHYGASGGYRTVDHRDILDSFPENIQDDFNGNEAMVEFMRRGNIRIMPEGDGINLSVLPTEAQEKALADFISRARGEVTLDIDNEYGDTVVSVEYPRGTRSDKVLRDIRQYFKDGTEPVVSDLSRFRYSDRDYSFDPELIADLQTDADKLKSDVANLKELLKLQKTVTHGTVFTKTSVNAAASKLMKTFGMNQGKIELASALNEFYRFVASAEGLSWESVMTEAGKVADRVIEIVPAREQRNDYSEKILKEIRNKGISLTDEQKTEIANKYDSYNNFRKSHMGSMILSDKGISLEKQWQEWAELYPDVFDKDVTAADMPEALSDIVSDLRLTRKMVKELDTAESRQMMLNEIYDSYWGVSTLHTLADRHQKQVNLLKSKHNSQMSELRAEYKEREKKTAQRYQEMIKRIREHKNRQMEEYKEAVRVSKERMSDQKKRTVMRNKIKKVVNELNQYLKGTKEKHVSEGMQAAVAEALSVINMDTVGADARIANLEVRIAKEEAKGDKKDPEIIEAYRASIARIRSQGDNLKSKLEALQLGYAKIKQSSDPSLASAYNKGIEDKIASVVDVVGNTPLRNMSMNQLEEVYDLYKLVLTSIRDRNKMFVTAQKETVQELGIEAKTELSEVSKKIEYINSVNKLLRKIGYKDLKPIYFFRMLGSKTMTKLYKAVSNGQGTWYKDMREAKSFRIKAEKEYNYKNWDMKKTYSFTSNSGSSFKLTLQQIMSIYAYYRRDEEKAIRHLVDGGFVFDKSISVIKKEKGVPVKYYVNTAEAFNLSETIINNIISTLSDEQRAYVEKMQAYLSDTMGAKGNEVSLKLYDVKLFKEKNYFPIKSSSTYMDYNPEESGEVKIKNSGFTKATNQFANNPIILDDFLNIWTSHVNDMSMYHAFVLPLEDFTRVYNYRNITDKRGAIQATIETNYTEAANSYIKQLLKDINGGSVSGVGTEVIDKMVGLAKKGAVFASASVVVQQPSAIARAMAYVNPKYFVNISSFNLKRHNQLWEECKQYAPVAGIKEMGYFDTSVGRTGIDWLKADEYDSVREKFFAFFKDKEQRRNIFDDALSFAPAMADELSWVALWEAVKKETRKTTNLEVGSEEFFKHCGERFTEVVDLTQVYDSVFARSELMRSKDRSVKMATSFMAEPTVQANMLFDAGLQLTRDFKGNKKAAISTASTVVTSVVVSVILNSLLKSLVTAGRDDDEEETYFEKYVASFTGDVLNGLNPLTLIPFVKDIISIVQGYSVDRMDMTVIESLITSVTALGKEAETPADKHKKWSNFVGAVTQIFGIPAKNIIRDFTGVFNTYNILTSGNKTTETGVKYALLESLSETPTAILTDKLSGGKLGIDVSKGKQYYDAVMGGDTAHANRIVASYGDKKKADTAIVKALRDHDPRVKEAAQAQIDGDDDKRIKLSREIIADGFKQDYVVKAVNAEINALKNGEEEEYSRKSQSLYTKEDYLNAALEGNSADAKTYKQEIIRADMENNGKTEEEAEESFYNSFKGLVKESIKEGGLTIERAANVLTNYGGLSAEKAFETAQYYDFTAQNPDLAYNWTSTTVAGYLETAEPSGISVEVYDDYLVKKKDCTGTDNDGDGKADSGTKKKEILKVIDSLPITSKQKDTLYVMNNWSKATLYEAPWH